MFYTFRVFYNKLRLLKGKNSSAVGKLFLEFQQSFSTTYLAYCPNQELMTCKLKETIEKYPHIKDHLEKVKQKVGKIDVYVSILFANIFSF